MTSYTPSSTFNHNQNAAETDWRDREHRLLLQRTRVQLLVTYNHLWTVVLWDLKSSSGIQTYMQAKDPYNIKYIKKSQNATETQHLLGITAKHLIAFLCSIIHA